MSADREFTDEELRIGSMRSIDTMAEALAAGDRDAALRFARRLRREVLSMLQNYEGWEATLRAKIVESSGADAEAEAMREIENPEIAPERCSTAGDLVERWKQMAGEISRAIEAGETRAATDLANALHDEALRSHDRGMSRVVALLSWIGRHQGSEGVDAALSKAMSADMLGNASFRERAEALMHFTRVHLQAFELEEDEEKLTFLCPVCPSGGRLLREGHYDPPRSNLHVQGPGPLTWGRDELPVYCCHEPIMERASIEATGVPLFVVEPSERLGIDPCPTHLYKDPAKIPERYYRRLGLEKPKGQ